MAKKVSEKKEVIVQVLRDMQFLDFDGVTFGNAFVVELSKDGKPEFKIGHPQGEEVTMLRKDDAFSAFTAVSDIAKGRYSILEETFHATHYDKGATGKLLNVAVRYNPRRSRWERLDFNGLTRKLEFGSYAPPRAAAKHDMIRRLVIGQRIVVPDYVQSAGNKWECTMDYGAFFLDLMNLTLEEAVAKSNKAIEDDATLRQAFAAGKDSARKEKAGKKVEKPKSLVFEIVVVDEVTKIALPEPVFKYDLMKLDPELGRVGFNVINNNVRWNNGKFTPTSAFDVSSFEIYNKKGHKLEVVKGYDEAKAYMKANAFVEDEAA